ncbi:type 2 cystatin [Plakobranchus ocellatus]|uniref:Type 2 cystatin n=1 Tax=Plakobranchus ocellatus TaxID=259542 RepID=A0AAV4CP50_9GAST|nr:type 2 cystatin [Plakobranchus ocellatus]
MWFFRRMLRIPWTAKKTNERVLNEANKRRSLVRTKKTLSHLSGPRDEKRKTGTFERTKMFLRESVCFALLTCLASPGWGEEIVGGLVAVHPPPSVVKFAVKHLKEFFKKREEPAPSSVEVIGATGQVVAGEMYGIHFLVNTTEKLELCHVFVWSRPWLSKLSLIARSIKCGVPPATKAKLERKGNMMSNNIMFVKSIEEPKLIKTFDNLVTEDLILYETNCIKPPHNISKCKANPNKPVLECFGYLFWSRVKFQVRRVTCSNV